MVWVLNNEVYAFRVRGLFLYYMSYSNSDSLQYSIALKHFFFVMHYNTQRFLTKYVLFIKQMSFSNNLFLRTNTGKQKPIADAKNESCCPRLSNTPFLLHHWLQQFAIPYIMYFPSPLVSAHSSIKKIHLFKRTLLSFPWNAFCHMLQHSRDSSVVWFPLWAMKRGFSFPHANLNSSNCCIIWANVFLIFAFSNC